jgi:hypothetical protein
MSESEPDQSPNRRSRLAISRQRLVELAVVVFGVLIALVLENLVQEMRFRADARELEQSFVGDIQEAVAQSLERQVVGPCLSERLRVLAERVDAATGGLGPADGERGGNIPFALPQVYRAPTRVWVTASFDRALGSEAFKRIPADRAAEYAGLFAQIALVQTLNEAEYIAISGLAPLAYSQPDLTAEVRADALQQIALVDRYQGVLAISSNQIIETAFSLSKVGDEVRRPFDEQKEALLEEFLESRTAYGDCVDLTVLDRLPRAPGS